MQSYKFSGDLIFLLYGLVALLVLSLLFSYITIKPNRWLGIWNTRGYTIYLWQNFSFIIAVVVMKIITPLNNVVGAMVLVFAISTILSAPLFRIENMIVEKIWRPGLFRRRQG